METLLYNNKSVVLATTQDTVILGGNMRRKRIVFQVNNNNPVFVNFGRPAVDGAGNGTGYTLQANKTEATIENPPVEEIHAVASIAGSAITVQEWFTK